MSASCIRTRPPSDLPLRGTIGSVTFSADVSSLGIATLVVVDHDHDEHDALHLL